MAFKFIDKSPEFIRDLESKIEKGLIQGSEMLTTNVRKNTRVDTGNLRAGTKETGNVKKSANAYTTLVENKVNYAIHQEYGTIHMQPAAMFRKGADQSVNPIQNILAKNLKV